MEENKQPIQKETPIVEKEAPKPEPVLRVEKLPEQHEDEMTVMRKGEREGAYRDTAELAAPVAPPVAPSAPVPASPEHERLRAIERILEEDLDEVYWRLSPEVQKEFKKEGEATAQKINGLMNAVRLHTAKILRLILRWLRVIPHVSGFFLEQEAKIKADSIAALHVQRRKP